MWLKADSLSMGFYFRFFLDADTSLVVQVLLFYLHGLQILDIGLQIRDIGLTNLYAQQVIDQYYFTQA